MQAAATPTVKTTGGVFVFLEQNGGIIEDVSFEVLGKGREIADVLHVPLSGVLLGDGLGEAAQECAKRGADAVYCYDSRPLAEFISETYLDVIAPLIEEKHPEIVLVGATHNGTTLAASLAIRLKVGLIAHVVDLEVDQTSKKVVGSVPGFGGSIVALCKCKKNPQLATVRPGIFKPAARREGPGGTVVQLPVGQIKARYKVLEKHVEQSSEIGRAPRVVVAGLGCREDLETPRKLAAAMGGTLAVSRPLADKGLAPKDLVVGSSGAALGAKVAVVVGVSGAAHFISGVRDVETVVAINSDPQAQIFQHADYCIIGDAGKIIPKVVAELGASAGGGAKA